MKPRRGKTAVLDFIGRCSRHSSWTAGAETGSDATLNKASAVSRLRKVTHPGSLVFMISDFRDMDKKAFAHIQNIARNSDIIMVNISDPIEAELPTSGSYKLTDGKNELQIQTSSRKTRDVYHQRYLSHRQQLEKFCRQHRIHLLNISTEDDVLETLKKGLGVNANSKRPLRRASQRL
jgi:uncharacterized protein (DUF58 family)